MFLWVLPNPDKAIASIMSEGLMINHNYGSYLYPPMGFIGVLENYFYWEKDSQNKPIILFNPLWLWGED
jgi:hypothetical protein